MGLWRARVSSFLVGFGVCGFGALFQIRQDVLHSYAEIKESVSASLLDSIIKLSDRPDMDSFLHHRLINTE